MALLDALNWFGESIDKPGRALRGLLAGRGGSALLEAMPFSDTLGFTDPRQSTSGRDLLEQWGAVGPRGADEGFGLGDVAGIGLEMALDPITQATGGALWKGLKAAKAAKMADQAAAVASIAKQAPGAIPSATDRFMSGLEWASPERSRLAPAGMALEAPSVASAASGSVGEGLGLASRFRPLHERFSSFRDVRPVDSDTARAIIQAIDEGGDIAPGYALSAMNPDAAGPAGWIGKIISRGPSQDIDKTFNRAISNIAERHSFEDLGPRLQGTYSPGQKTAITFGEDLGARDPIGTRRHEQIHGLINQAARSGEYEDLPLLMRIPAQLQGAAYAEPKGSSWRGLLEGVSHIGDELAAHSLQNRGLGDQIAGAADFMIPGPAELLSQYPSVASRVLSPQALRGAMGRAGVRAGYADDFAQTFPAAGEMYRRLGLAPWQAAAAAGTLGAGAGLEYLLPNSALRQALEQESMQP